jgi:hypothetical protein
MYLQAEEVVAGVVAVEEVAVEEAAPAESVMASQREPPTAWPKARARVTDSAKATLMDCARVRVSDLAEYRHSGMRPQAMAKGSERQRLMQFRYHKCRERLRLRRQS